MIISLLILNLIDLAQTLWALPTGMFKEGNTIALTLYSYSPWAMVAYKLFFTGIACYLLYVCKHRVGNYWMLYIPHGIMVLIVAWNFLNIALYLGDL